MELNLDSRTVHIHCPGCGQAIPKTIGGLKLEPKFVCACGQPHRVDLSQFEQDLAGAQQHLNGIGRALDGLLKG